MELRKQQSNRNDEIRVDHFRQPADIFRFSQMHPHENNETLRSWDFVVHLDKHDLRVYQEVVKFLQENRVSYNPRLYLFFTHFLTVMYRKFTHDTASSLGTPSHLLQLRLALHNMHRDQIGNHPFHLDVQVDIPNRSTPAIAENSLVQLEFSF